MRRWSSFVPGGYAGNLRRELTVDNLTSAGGGGADGAVHSAHKAAVGNIAHLRSGTITDEACTTFISLTLGGGARATVVTQTDTAGLRLGTDTFSIAVDAVSGGESEQRGREDGVEDHVEGFQRRGTRSTATRRWAPYVRRREGERRGETWRWVRNGRDDGDELKAGGGAKWKGALGKWRIMSEGGGRHNDGNSTVIGGMMMAMIVLDNVEHLDAPTTDAAQSVAKFATRRTSHGANVVAVERGVTWRTWARQRQALAVPRRHCAGIAGVHHVIEYVPL
ncbi:hypothetical protein FGB62_95g084 [Gracilaria domingensis]|nr:hypothetical protein FGB62_95g084 [Gracilaria domingensis]